MYLIKGDEVECLEEKGEWYKIRYYGKKYSLYSTETPNIFRDRNNDLWSAIPRKTEGLYYIPLKSMSPEQQLLIMEKVAGASAFAQRIMVDVHGKECLRWSWQSGQERRRVVMIKVDGKTLDLRDTDGDEEFKGSSKQRVRCYRQGLAAGRRRSRWKNKV